MLIYNVVARTKVELEYLVDLQLLWNSLIEREVKLDEGLLLTIGVF